MKINPTQSKDAYENQNQFSPPPDGTYHMVGVTIQRKAIGKKGTPCLTVGNKILKCVDGEGTTHVGKTWGMDLWWDLSKKGNIDRASIVALAMGNEEEFDPESDSDLVRVYTGHVYQVKLETRTDEWEGKTTKKVEVLEVKRLSDDVRKKYASAPDWKKMLGEPKARVLEAKDYSKGSKGSSKSESSDGGRDPFGGDDIPF